MAHSAIVSLPEPAPPVPLGHRGPRGAILLHLKRHGQATPRDLALGLGISLNAVRHHLKELQTEGVVGYDRARRGVGAPAHAYRLSAAGHALFPDRYAQTVADLLEHVVATQGRAAAVALLATQFRTLAGRLVAEVAGLSYAERGAAIARVLHGEGFMATWEAAEHGGLLTEFNCPHRVIAEQFPELCQAEEALLAEVLGARVTRNSRISGGCGTCSYRVAFGGAEGDTA